MNIEQQSRWADVAKAEADKWRDKGGRVMAEPALEQVNVAVIADGLLAIANALKDILAEMKISRVGYNLNISLPEPKED